VSLRAGVARSAAIEEVPARNVAGLLPGRDPALAGEWIVVGGHHDHIGGHPGSGDTIYNGADDNASGTSGVLQLAAAFASRAERTRRSIVFITFTGEEEGLLGSRALVGQRHVPLERVVLMLNLDMIGRNPDKPIQLAGDGFARGLREIVEAANRGLELPLDFGGARYAGNSDHDPFYDEDVPFLFFFSGIHDDYHQPADHADKLDYGRMESIVRLAYGVVERVAQDSAAPRFVHHVDWLGLQLDQPARGARATIGVVDEGSRAAAAGLRAGDVIVALDDEALEPDRVGRRLRDVEPGARVSLGLARGEQELALAVERARPGYLGVYPASLEDEQRRALGLHADQGLVLRQVTSGGPADRAGLKRGDVLVALAGRSVGREDLGQRLMQLGAGETVDVTVIRDARRLTLPLTLGEAPVPE
jgi:hypothetical protein